MPVQLSKSLECFTEGRPLPECKHNSERALAPVGRDVHACGAAAASCGSRTLVEHHRLSCVVRRA